MVVLGRQEMVELLEGVVVGVTFYKGKVVYYIRFCGRY